MRVYRFLDAKYGLKSLLEKRLKISRLDELNDPFELIPYDLSNQQQRWAVHRTRDYLAQVNGMLCFSGNWRDPVLWAHYSDKHYGLCIQSVAFPTVTNRGTHKGDALHEVRQLAI